MPNLLSAVEMSPGFAVAGTEVTSPRGEGAADATFSGTGAVGTDASPAARQERVSGGAGGPDAFQGNKEAKEADASVQLPAGAQRRPRAPLQQAQLPSTI